MTRSSRTFFLGLALCAASLSGTAYADAAMKSDTMAAKKTMQKCLDKAKMQADMAKREKMKTDCGKMHSDTMMMKKNTMKTDTMGKDAMKGDKMAPAN